MKKIDKQTGLGRRAFLSGSVAVAAGTTIATTMPGIAASVTPAEEAIPVKQDDGYRLTSHIATYYKTTMS